MSISCIAIFCFHPTIKEIWWFIIWFLLVLKDGIVPLNTSCHLFFEALRQCCTSFILSSNTATHLVHFYHHQGFCFFALLYSLPGRKHTIISVLKLYGLYISFRWSSQIIQRGFPFHSWSGSTQPTRNSLKGTNSTNFQLRWKAGNS